MFKHHNYKKNYLINLKSYKKKLYSTIFKVFLCILYIYIYRRAKHNISNFKIILLYKIIEINFIKNILSTILSIFSIIYK